MRSSLRSAGLESRLTCRPAAICHRVSKIKGIDISVWVRHLEWGVALLLSSTAVSAEDVPRPPCSATPIPAYPDLGAGAAVQALTDANFDENWTPPDCTGWTSPGTPNVDAARRSPAEDVQGRPSAIRHLEIGPHESHRRPDAVTGRLDCRADTPERWFAVNQRPDDVPEAHGIGARLRKGNGDVVRPRCSTHR
jgi:hypothetical protein